MDEVKSHAKWWNNEVVVPSLRTSLCMLSGPGALPRLRNLSILMRVAESTSATHDGWFWVKMLQIAESFIHLTFSTIVYYFH